MLTETRCYSRASVSCGTGVVRNNCSQKAPGVHRM
jgi:hypothetical protein